MPRISKTALTLAVALFLLFLPGCKSGRSTAARDREILTRHNFSAPHRLASAPEPGLAPAGVWRIDGPRNTVYLAGTSHLVTPEQIPFPSAFYAAYNDSAEICIESDTREPSFIARAKILTQMFSWVSRNRAEFVLPPSESLTNLLQAATNEKLRAKYGKKFSGMQRQTPLFLAFITQMQNFGGQYIEDGGVEDVFAARARKDRKKIRTLDDSSINDLIPPILDDIVNDLRAELNKSGPDALLEKIVLAEPEKIVETAWRSGDLKSLETDFELEKQKSPALFEALGPNRNRKWLPKIKAHLQRDKNIFILVGSAHLPGPDGLLQLLRDEGFQPTQLHGHDHLNSDRF